MVIAAIAKGVDWENSAWIQYAAPYVYADLSSPTTALTRFEEIRADNTNNNALLSCTRSASCSTRRARAIIRPNGPVTSTSIVCGLVEVEFLLAARRRTVEAGLGDSRRRVTNRFNSLLFTRTTTSSSTGPTHSSCSLTTTHTTSHTHHKSPWRLCFPPAPTRSTVFLQSPSALMLLSALPWIWRSLPTTWKHRVCGRCRRHRCRRHSSSVVRRDGGSPRHRVSRGVDLAPERAALRERHVRSSCVDRVLRDSDHRRSAALAGPAAWRARRLANRRGDNRRLLGICMAASAASAFVFYSLSVSKLANYTLAFLPPLAILIGLHLDEELERPTSRLTRVSRQAPSASPRCSSRPRRSSSIASAARVC